MWFCTQDGLNRYDGYDFKIYRHEVSNENSLSNNYVWYIYEDNEGIFWIATFGGGLTRFDPFKETFKHFKRDANNPNSISNNFVFEVIEYPAGIFWIATDGGLNRLDKKSGSFKHYINIENKTAGLNNNHVESLITQEDDKLWFTSDSGLSCIDINTEELKYYKEDPFEAKISFGTIYDIKKENENFLLACDAGLVKLDFINQKAEILLSIEKFREENPGIIFQTILIDEQDYYWIGTSIGLVVLEKSSGSYYHFAKQADNTKSLTHNNILSICRSSDGATWIGTRNGLNRVDKIKNDFTLFKHNTSDKNSINHGSVGPIIKDKNGLLWIGTDDGLNVYDKHTNKFIHMNDNVNYTNPISSNYILALLEDDMGNIWVGTRGGGLNCLTFDQPGNPEIFSVKNYSFREGLSSPTIQCLLQDSKGIIWIGTGGGGLNKLNPETGEIKTYSFVPDGSGPSHSYIFNIYEDSFGNYWIGTASGGLDLFDPVSEKFIYMKNSEVNPYSLSNNLILSTYEDKDHNLWIGTAGGLNKLAVPLRENLFDYFNNNIDPAKDSLFVHYGRAQGLPNEVIYGILQDDNGNFWFSTNKGIVKFNPSKPEPVIKIFDYLDGLQNDEFNQSSYFKDDDGKMYFGGVDGFNSFYPDSIKFNSYIPSVYFTDFKLFNETVTVKHDESEKEFHLSESIIHTKELNLHYDHDVISFEFAALNFIHPEKNQYAYMMEGFDDDWIPAGDKRSVTYTNLDEGEYFFRVKASNNDGIWNEKGASIKIFIPPPPWLSWYAYLIYIAVFSVSVFLFIRYRINIAKREIETQAKIEKAKLEEREEVRKKSSADFHDEAGNKLTKITLFTELAKDAANDNPSVIEYLEKIEENTKEISSGMRDFIWVLDPAKDTLQDTIDRLKDFGYSMFGYTNVKFNVKEMTTEMNSVNLSMELRRAIMLIFKEAMNNCLKYAEAKNIEIEISTNENKLIISLSDDGKGFDVDEKSNGYGLKNMRHRASKSGAELSIDSKPGKGTEITFKTNIAHLGN